MPEKPITPLKKLRESRGLTQSEVCEAVGVDQTTYSKIESATHTPRKENTEAIVKYFGSAITELHIIFPERYPDYEVGQR